MKLRRPECDEQPSKPNSLNSVTNQLTTLFAFRWDPRYERITGPIGGVVWARRSKARRRSGCIGIRRPPRFFAMTSRTLIVPDTRPCGSRTIDQLRPAISQARRPAFMERRIIARSRARCDDEAET